MLNNVFQLIKRNSHLIMTILGVAVVILWYLNGSFWHILWLNWIFLFFYLVVNSNWWGNILSGIFKFEKEVKFIFGFLFLIFLVGFCLSLPIVFYKFLSYMVYAVLLMLTILASTLNKIVKNKETLPRLFVGSDTRPVRKFFYVIFFALSAICLFLLIRSRAELYFANPWTRINPLYLDFYFLLLLSFFYFLCQKPKFKKFFLILVFLSLLSHLFLIILYPQGFGGDKWRHLAAEKYLAEGKVYSPALFGETTKYATIGPLKIPEVFVVGNKTSYSSLWALTLGGSFLTGASLYSIDLLLVFLLFSLCAPFLFFKIGSFLSSERSFLYLFSSTPLLFSSFLIYGSISMPMMLGFLFFLFSLICLYQAWKTSIRGWKLLVVFLFFAALLYLNYILYLILYLLISLIFLLWQKVDFSVAGKKKFYLFCLFLVLILSALSLDFFDTWGNNSQFTKSNLNPLKIVQSGVIFAGKFILGRPIFPRVGGLEQDNWLYAISGKSLSGGSLLQLTNWPVLVTPVVLLLISLGILFRKKIFDKFLAKVLVALYFILLVNQFVATSLMQGNHLFTKRVVVFFTFLSAIFFVWGSYQLWLIFLKKKNFQLFLTYIFAIGFALLGTTVLASGPKFQMVTLDESKSAEYLWSKIRQEPKPYCVIANTWPLLALEYASSKEIEAGGFPVYYEYQQPERVFIFDQMTKAPSIRYLGLASQITGAKKCYIMMEKRFINFKNQTRILDQLNRLFGSPQQIGDVFIWEEARPVK